MNAPARNKGTIPSYHEMDDWNAKLQKNDGGRLKTE
jgi:hypothetical protein